MNISDSVKFHSFKPRGVNIDQIVSQISVTTDIHTLAETFYNNGGTDLIEISKRCLNIELFKKFSRQYELIKQLDCQNQKKCYELHKSNVSDYTELLRNYVFDILKNYKHKIVIYGSGVIKYFSSYPIKFNSISCQDIDVATENPFDLGNLIYTILVDQPVITDMFRLKNIQFRHKLDRYFIRVDISDMCQNYHFLKRINLIDICDLNYNNIIKNNIPTHLSNIWVQHPMSFWLGLFDKYYGCINNVNNLTRTELNYTQKILDDRLNNMILPFDWYDDIESYQYFISFFNNLNKFKILNLYINKK